MKILTRSTIAAVALAGLVAGTAGPADAIVGGQDATQSYPGVVAVSTVYPGLGTALCGGTLISAGWVLTAAHCVSDQLSAPTPIPAPGGNVTVRIGSADRTTGGQVVTGKRVYLHPDWAWGTNGPTTPVADLALVELARRVTATVQRLDIHQPAVGSAVRLVGWGLTAFPPAAGQEPATMLRQRDTTRVPDAACAGGFAGAGEVCLGMGACFGDSGSPALTGAGQVGVASRETSADDPCGQPMVYTNPTYPPFRRWIWTTILTGQTLPCTCPPTTAAHASLANSFRLHLR